MRVQINSQRGRDWRFVAKRFFEKGGEGGPTLQRATIFCFSKVGLLKRKKEVAKKVASTKPPGGVPL